MATEPTTPRPDGHLAARRTFGRALSFGLQLPIITNTRPDETINKAADLKLWCEIGPCPVTRVEAAVSYTGAIHTADEPVTNFQILELAREGTERRWTGVLPAATFTQNGTYRIIYTAYREDGFENGNDLAATPVARIVRVGPEPSGAIWVMY